MKKFLLLKCGSKPKVLWQFLKNAASPLAGEPQITGACFRRLRRREDKNKFELFSIYTAPNSGWGARAVESGSLENCYTRKGIVSSNLTPTATKLRP